MALIFKDSQDVQVSIRNYNYKLIEFVRSMDEYYLRAFETQPNKTFEDARKIFSKSLEQMVDLADQGVTPVSTIKRTMNKDYLVFLDEVDEIYKRSYKPLIEKIKSPIMKTVLKKRFEVHQDLLVESFNTSSFLKESTDRRNEKLAEIDIESVTLSQLTNVLRIHGYKEQEIAAMVSDRYLSVLLDSLKETEYGYDYENLELYHYRALSYAYSEEFRYVKFEIITKVDKLLVDNESKALLVSVLNGDNSPIIKTFSRIRNKIQQSVTGRLIDYVPEEEITKLDFTFELQY